MALFLIKQSAKAGLISEMDEVVTSRLLLTTPLYVTHLFCWAP